MFKKNRLLLFIICLLPFSAIYSTEKPPEKSNSTVNEIIVEAPWSINNDRKIVRATITCRLFNKYCKTLIKKSKNLSNVKRNSSGTEIFSFKGGYINNVAAADCILSVDDDTYNVTPSKPITKKSIKRAQNSKQVPGKKASCAAFKKQPQKPKLFNGKTLKEWEKIWKENEITDYKKLKNSKHVLSDGSIYRPLPDYCTKTKQCRIFFYDKKGKKVWEHYAMCVLNECLQDIAVTGVFESGFSNTSENSFDFNAQGGACSSSMNCSTKSYEGYCDKSIPQKNIDGQSFGTCVTRKRKSCTPGQRQRCFSLRDLKMGTQFCESHTKLMTDCIPD